MAGCHAIDSTLLYSVVSIQHKARSVRKQVRNELNQRNKVRNSRSQRKDRNSRCVRCVKWEQRLTATVR